MNSEYLIKNFCFESTPSDVFELMKNKHKKSHKKLKKEFYKKKYSYLYYRENPLLSKLIYHKDVPIAHVGAFPMLARIENINHRILQIGDIVTHSDYRGKGLFLTLINAIIEDAKEKGFSFLFVVPNTNALPIFQNKLNWKPIQENVFFSIKTKTFYLNKVFNKLNLVVIYEKLFDLVNRKYRVNRNNVINPNSSNELCSGIIKDAKFYKYKTYAKNYLYKFKNGIIWFKLDDGITVGNILPKEGESIGKLMVELKSFANKRGIHIIKIHQSKKDKLYKYFENSNYAKHNFLPVFTFSLDENIDLTNWRTCLCDYNTF